MILVSIAMIAVDHRQGHLETVRTVLSAFVYPLQYVVNIPVQAGRWASQSLVTNSELLAENSRLREQQLLLNARLQKYSALEEENNRLRKLLESSPRLRERVLIAELIAVDMESFRKQVIINKGQRDGVYEGQPVVDANGIMGQVIHVSLFSSTVLLITDPLHSIPVQVNRNGLRAIAVGTGRDETLLLENMPTNSDIITGDLLISSGLGRRFPRGYPVGEIRTIKLEPGEAFAYVEVTPSANLTQNQEVLLVWPFDESAEPDKNREQAAN